MSDYLEDVVTALNPLNQARFQMSVVTALNQGRFQMSDDFREMHKSNKKFIETNFQDWVNSVAQGYGDDSWQFYGTAIVAGVFDTLYTFVGDVGEATFIDPLRLGEGVKQGGFGYVQDGLRVMGIFGGAFKLLKFARLGRVAGGPMSCSSTSLAKAARLASVEFTTMEEIANGTGSGLKFGDSGPLRGAWLEDVLPKIQKIVTVESKPVSSASEIEALVAQRKGPVVFSVEWKGSPGIPGGGHSMMAYQDARGAFRLADQFGNSHSWRTGANGLEVIAGPGSTNINPGAIIGNVSRFYSQSGGGVAHILRETVLMQAAANAPLAQRIGIPLLRPFDKHFNLKLGLAASMMPSAPTPLKNAAINFSSVINLNDLPITDSEKLVGWWFVWVGSYFWTYVFNKNGKVRWTDPYNHKSGVGKWEVGNGIKIKWSPPSTSFENWNPINVNNQTGTYHEKKGVTLLKAVKIGTQNSGVIKNIVGRWKVNVSKWTWNYDFDAFGGVKWTDPFNGKTGMGQWTVTKDGLYTWWTPHSRTTEIWNGSLDSRVLAGTANMSTGKFPLKAEKVS